MIQKPVKLPILKLMKMSVPWVAFTSVSRRKPQLKRHRCKKALTRKVLKNTQGIEQMLKNLERGTNINIYRRHFFRISVEVEVRVDNMVSLLFKNPGKFIFGPQIKNLLVFTNAIFYEVEGEPIAALMRIIV